MSARAKKEEDALWLWNESAKYTGLEDQLKKRN